MSDYTENAKNYISHYGVETLGCEIEDEKAVKFAQDAVLTMLVAK